MTSSDLSALCRHSEMPLMYGTEAYILFLLLDSLDSLVQRLYINFPLEIELKI